MDNKDEELLFVMLCGLWRAALFMFSESFTLLLWPILVILHL